MAEQALVPTNPRAISAGAAATSLDKPGSWTMRQVAILKEHIARNATDDELRYFGEVCRRLNLDPFKKEIYFIKRWDSRLKREVPQFQTGIDGFRKVTAANPKFHGLVGPQWCGPDEVWKDVWIPEEPPVAARVGIRLAGSVEPTWGVAMYREFCQRTKEGAPTGLWGTMPANQLAKCAEAQAHRKITPGATEIALAEEPPAMSYTVRFDEPASLPEAASVPSYDDEPTTEQDDPAPASRHPSMGLDAPSWWDQFRADMERDGIRPVDVAKYLERPFSEQDVAESGVRPADILAALRPVGAAS